MVIHAFVTSRIDYCYSLLFGLPNYELAIKATKSAERGG